jgi:Bacterial PH domain
LSGKKVEFISIPWKNIRGYSVETPGSFLDFDSELRIFTNIPNLKLFFHDLKKGKGNLWAIQTCLNNHLLGPDEDLLPDIDQKEGHEDPVTSIFGRGNSRPLDAVEVNKTFHTNPPLLQSKETVEMAFKGIRDVLLFTTKRVIMVDTKGLTGKRVEYKSMPWSSIIGFAVCTAGTVDHDTEMYLWTEMSNLKVGDETKPYWSMWSQ